MHSTTIVASQLLHSREDQLLHSGDQRGLVYTVTQSDMKVQRVCIVG